MIERERGHDRVGEALRREGLAVERALDGRAALDRARTEDFALVLLDITRRDERDSSRAVAPLRPASDAMILDTTALDAEAADLEPVGTDFSDCEIQPVLQIVVNGEEIVDQRFRSAGTGDFYVLFAREPPRLHQGEEVGDMIEVMMRQKN